MAINLQMTSKPVLLGFSLLMMFYQNKNDFKNKQLKYQRVKNAYQEKHSEIKSLLATKGVIDGNFLLFIRIFKKEEVMEIWVKGNADHKYRHLIDYPFCANSGMAGPKRKSGDEQIPEGFYFIDRFNPGSNFHLSLGINYPNDSDRVLGYKKNLGGDIFLHENLYILAVEAKHNGQNYIPVHIFPGKTIKTGQWEEISELTNRDLIDFWKNLKPGFDYFEKNHLIPTVKVRQNGDYYVEEL